MSSIFGFDAKYSLSLHAGEEPNLKLLIYSNICCLLKPKTYIRFVITSFFKVGVTDGREDTMIMARGREVLSSNL